MTKLEEALGGSALVRHSAVDKDVAVKVESLRRGALADLQAELGRR